ncbi:MAG: bifunctional phosphoglucose/phosphomannose isomerase [Saprospiraceae bacterium]|nr:bifunctional phosphoglucose/phosphomannose isomerase [Saprospiraceae bacterium]
MMKELIAKFPAQLIEALEIGEKAEIHGHSKPINKVFIAGLGGSGIGGDFVAAFIKDECKVPVLVGKSYHLPAFIDENTLYIASSYSGNTEEVLHATTEAQKTGAQIVIIASGGKLLQLAQEKTYDCIALPPDYPSPRACLGFSMVAQLSIMHKLGIISRSALDQIKSSVDLLKYDQDEIKSKALKVAKLIAGKTPIIYVSDRMEAVALRFKQQINENAKTLSWYNVIPEMNHNELVGWSDMHNDAAVIYFRNKDDFKRNALRMDISKEIIAKQTHTVIEIFSKGQSLVEKSMYFTHLGDWISLYLAELKPVDPSEIKVIDFLKTEMGKI